jgi:hypothetical protein
MTRPLKFSRPGLAFRPDPPPVVPRPRPLPRTFALTAPDPRVPPEEKYRLLELRRRRAQIAARRALDRERSTERECPKLPFAV